MRLSENRRNFKDNGLHPIAKARQQGTIESRKRESMLSYEKVSPGLTADTSHRGSLCFSRKAIFAEYVEDCQGAYRIAAFRARHDKRRLSCAQGVYQVRQHGYNNRRWARDDRWFKSPGLNLLPWKSRSQCHETSELRFGQAERVHPLSFSRPTSTCTAMPKTSFAANGAFDEKGRRTTFLCQKAYKSVSLLP